MKESRDRDIVINISDYEKPFFTEMLKYMYNQKLEVHNEEDIIELLVLSDKFSVHSLAEECVDQLTRQLNYQTCVLYLNLLQECPTSEMFNQLRYKCYSLLEEKFKILHKSNYSDLLQLDANSLSWLFTNDKILITSDNTVFQIIQQWIILQQECPSQFDIINLLNCVRFDNMNLDFLCNVVSHSNVFDYINDLSARDNLKVTLLIILMI